MLNTLLFVVLPYVAITIAIIGCIYRAIYHPFSVSSMSSQLLERKKLYWGSVPFHWGLIFILIGHLIALFLPRGLTWWNSVPIRLYILEGTGLALALWSLGGLIVLIWRRLSEKRIRVITTPMDLIVLLFLLISIVTGIGVAGTYRFGSSWFTAVFTPYLWSLVTFSPKPELLADLPFLIQLHAINFFALLIILPFSRLVHIFALPLGYLIRPWQIVIWMRRKRTESTSKTLGGD